MATSSIGATLKKRKQSPPTRRKRGSSLDDVLFSPSADAEVSEAKPPPPSTTRRPKPSEFDALAGWGSVARAERAASIQGAIIDETKISKKISFASPAEELSFLRSENYRLMRELHATEEELEASRARHAADLEAFSPGDIMRGTGLEIYKTDESPDGEKTNQSEVKDHANDGKNGRPPLHDHESESESHSNAGHHHHGRSEDNVDHKIVSIVKPPILL